MNLIKVLELNLVGVSFHVGSNCTSVGYFKKAIADCRKVFDLGYQIIGKKLSILDIGGGFPGFDNECGITFQDICQEIREGYQESFADIRDDVTVIAEPGRFFSTKSHTLVFNIINLQISLSVQRGFGVLGV